jgi:hypothetical protein
MEPALGKRLRAGVGVGDREREAEQAFALSVEPPAQPVAAARGRRQQLEAPRPS